MNWSDLSMSQRSELMQIYLKNGITSLDEMKKHYNSFAKGGNTGIPPKTQTNNPFYTAIGASGLPSFNYITPLDKATQDRFDANYRKAEIKNAPRTAIGGNTKEAREKVWQTYPEISHAVDSVAKAYSINPNLLRYNLDAEGFTDGVIRAHNNSVNTTPMYWLIDGITNKQSLFPGTSGLKSGGGYYGLDDAADLINSGKVNLINETWEAAGFVNEKGRHTNSVYSTPLDNIGITAATLKYFRDKAKEDFPNETEEEYDRLARAYFNRGLTGGYTWGKSKRKGYTFAQGGSIDDPPSPKQSADTVSGADRHPYNSKLDRAQRSWLQHWYDNRSLQLAQNLKDYQYGSAGSTIGSIFTASNRYKNNMFNYADNVPIIDRRVLNAKEATDVAESLGVLPTIEDYQYNKSNERGFYTGPYGYKPVIGITPNGDETTPLHEFVHAMQHAGRHKSFYPYGAQVGAIYNNLDKTKYNDRYLDKPEEIYSRLMQIRYSNKINPRHRWSKEELQKFKKEAKDFDILNRYDDDLLLYLFNDVADVGQSNIDNYAAKGGKLDIPPYWGQPTNKKDSPIDYLSRYVNSQAFARRAPNQSYIKRAKNAVNNFNGVTNSQWREYSIGPHINEYNNTITMYPGRIDTPYAPYENSFEAPYMAILAHEYGHLIDPNYGKENNVPKSYTDLYKTIIPKADSHDSRPDEIYADLQSLRYQLYENNIFDIINDGTFNESHLDKALKQGVPNRLLYTMPKEAIIQMMNTIADNGSQDAIANIVADGGKIHIKPENRGKFTALKKRTGHSAS